MSSNPKIQAVPPPEQEQEKWDHTITIRYNGRDQETVLRMFIRRLLVAALDKRPTQPIEQIGSYSECHKRFIRSIIEDQGPLAKNYCGEAVIEVSEHPNAIHITLECSNPQVAWNLRVRKDPTLNEAVDALAEPLKLLEILNTSQCGTVSININGNTNANRIEELVDTLLQASPETFQRQP